MVFRLTFKRINSQFDKTCFLHDHFSFYKLCLQVRRKLINNPTKHAGRGDYEIHLCRESCEQKCTLDKDSQ